MCMVMEGKRERRDVEGRSERKEEVERGRRDRREEEEGRKRESLNIVRPAD